MDQDKIDELQEEMRRKTDGPKQAIVEAEKAFSDAIEKEKDSS